VRFENGMPVTAGAIDGRPASVLIDSGSAVTLVTNDAAQRLGLSTRSTPERMGGIGGASRLAITYLKELRVGNLARADMRVHVGGERPIPGVDVVLGEDVLHAVDLEYDYARGVVRAFDPKGCERAWLAYWDPDAQVLPVEYDSSAIRIPVTVNGRRATGILDSGASGTIVALQFAIGVGVSSDTPGVRAMGCARGLGAEALPAWVGRFDSVVLAGETIRDARLAFADFTFGDVHALGWRAPALSYSDRTPDVLIGNDFLRTHRVYVARSQDKLYFTYLGGTVFPESPAPACGERLR
jgi:predicted aspartyl protease